VLHRLRTLGVRIAIDDFGAGQSSLWRLRNLPADELKIDRSFIRALGDGEVDERLVAHILELARTFGMVATAEGVETEAQLRVLSGLGCDFVQGYLTGRPLPADDFAALIGAAAVAHVG
jgi:EAL domain-containing protein (putative c-di-GMP-specific phosphodiesterase class I)